MLPWSLHCSVALMLVEAHSKLLPTHPGGRDYVPHVSALRNVSLSHFHVHIYLSNYVRICSNTHNILYTYYTNYSDNIYFCQNEKGVGLSLRHFNSFSSFIPSYFIVV